MVKNSFQLGLEQVLNNKDTNFLNNSHVFNEIHRNSGMSISQMMRHIGKNKKEKSKEPSEKEKSEQRLKELEAKSNQ